MSVHGIGAEPAWRLLTQASSQTNTRVRLLAQALIAMVSGSPADDPEAVTVVIDRLLRPAASDRVAAEFVARLISR